MNKPIGIFDSGLGGLTVLRELAQRFPQESFCYLGDIARLPYGNKSPETIRKYGLQVLEFLVKQEVKALIIACNSASSVFLEENEFQGLPLLNVIGPGSEAAVEVAKDHRVGVLGTSATIRSGAYKTRLLELSPGLKIWEEACPLLVPLVEEGLINDPITEQVLERYLVRIKQEQVKTIILGCTHYPVLRPDLQKVLGPEVNLIESGAVLARQLQHLFETNTLIPNKAEKQSLRVCITDITDQFERLAQQLMGPDKGFSLERVVL